MTQFVLAVNGALMAVQASVITLTSLDDETKALVVFGCSIVLAFINPWLPKVSVTLRTLMDLRKR